MFYRAVRIIIWKAQISSRKCSEFKCIPHWDLMKTSTLGKLSTSNFGEQAQIRMIRSEQPLTN
jgi:hypothetical protein